MSKYILIQAISIVNPSHSISFRLNLTFECCFFISKQANQSFYTLIINLFSSKLFIILYIKLFQSELTNSISIYFMMNTSLKQFLIIILKIMNLVYEIYLEIICP